jgi:GNAT superfamily N-acetyltransferase
VALSVRRCEDDADLARSVSIYNAVWPARAVTTAEVEAWRRAARDSTEFLAALDGVDVGSAAASIEHQHPEACFTLITVLREHRRRGVGTALYEAVSTWAADRGINLLETRVLDDDPSGLDFARRRGFAEISVESGLELDVRSARVDDTRPDGFEIFSLAARPELAEGTFDVAADAIPDVPGDHDWRPPPRERWVHEHLLGPATPPEAVVAAVADGEVIAYAKLYLKPDGRTAVHGMTAVMRAWRGRGVATALKNAQIRWAKEQGLERLRADNERRNEPMLRVNRRLGYLPAAGRVTLRGPLAGSSLSARRDA